MESLQNWTVAFGCIQVDHYFQFVGTSDLLAKDSKQCKDPHPFIYHFSPRLREAHQILKLF